MQGYEEEFDDNPFYQLLKRKYPQILGHAQEQRYVVCVPMSGSMNVSKVTKDDVESHILRWSDEAVVTINGKALRAEGSELHTGEGFPSPRTVSVLFEETFYNARDESYRVVCIDRPLAGSVLVSQALELETLAQCDAFLWRVRHDRKVRSRIQGLFQQFEDAWTGLHNSKGTIGLTELGDAVNAVYTRALQIILTQSTHRKMKSSRAHMEALRTSVEVFVLYGVAYSSTTALSTICGPADAALNRQTRNLYHLGGADFGLPDALTSRLAEAVQEIELIPVAATPIGKLQCVEAAVNILIEGSGMTISADELIPLLSMLIIQSSIANWTAELRYIEQLQLYREVPQQLRYMQVSLEGALTHIGGGGLVELGLLGRAPSRQSREDKDGMVEKYWKAVQENDAETVAGIIEVRKEYEKNPAVVTLSACDDLGRTALHTAARVGSIDVLSALIELGADVNARDTDESTPLHLSCRDDQVNCTLILLQQGANRNSANADGDTPLHYCAVNGHERCAKAFFFDGSDNTHVNVRNNAGWTPLHAAAKWGYGPIVALLLMHGADRTVRTSRGEVAAQMSLNQHIVSILTDREVSTATREFMFNSLPSSPSPGESDAEGVPHDVAPPHVDIGAVTDALNRSGSGGASRGSVKKGHWFRSFRALSGESSSQDQSTPNRTRRQDDLAVFLDAIEGGDSSFIRRTLMVKQSGTNVSPPRAKSAAGAVPSKCHPLCQCEKCVRRGGTISSEATIRDLVLTANSDGLCAVHVAALHGQTEIVQLLVRAGCSPNYPTKGAVTPLHCASQYNHQETVRKLMSLNANPDSADNNGNTPLHFCAQNGHIESACLLLSGMVMIDAQNNRGDTPLHNATRWNDAQLVEQLIQEGASVDLPNKAGKSAADLARGREIAAVFNQDEKAVSTELLVCHIQPPYFHLNGRYIQIGLMPRTIYGGRPSERGSEEKLPVFQRRDPAPANAEPGVAGQHAVMYYDGAREAWVLAMSVGSEDVLAFACTQADHPAINTSAWSVASGDGGFRIDLDVDVVGIDGSVATDSAFNSLSQGWDDDDQQPVVNDGNGHLPRSGVPTPVVGGVSRGVSPMSDSLARIRAEDVRAKLDEVDGELIRDRSSPQIDARLATLFAICRFDKGSLQSARKDPRRLSLPGPKRTRPGRRPLSASMHGGPTSSGPLETHTEDGSPSTPVGKDGTPRSAGRLWRTLSLSSLDGIPPDLPSHNPSEEDGPHSLPFDQSDESYTASTPLNFKRDSDLIAKLQGLPSLSTPLDIAVFEDDTSLARVPSPPAPSLV